MSANAGMIPSPMSMPAKGFAPPVFFSNLGAVQSRCSRNSGACHHQRPLQVQHAVAIKISNCWRAVIADIDILHGSVLSHLPECLHVPPAEIGVLEAAERLPGSFVVLIWFRQRYVRLRRRAWCYRPRSRRRRRASGHG